MGHLLQAVQGANVVERVDRRTEPTVQAEDLAVHQGGERQKVEQIREMLPHGRIAVFAEALVVKTVNLGDLTGFVIASQNCYSFAVSNL